MTPSERGIRVGRLAAWFVPAACVKIGFAVGVLLPPPPIVGAAVREHAEQIRLARRLVELRDAPVTVDLEAARVQPERYDKAALVAWYEERRLPRLASMLTQGQSG